MRKLTLATTAFAAIVALNISGCMNNPRSGMAHQEAGAGHGAMGAMGAMCPAMMGPGMMAPGQAYGPGMMMGAPGTMMGLERLDLSAEQRSRIAQIQDQARQQHLAWMQAMQAPGGPMAGAMTGDALDEAATRRAYETMSAMHKQMFESHLQTRQRILEVLTPAQREQLGRGWRGGRPGS